MSAKTALILLAAGESSRMGFPKQLLQAGEETLIELAVRKALSLPETELYVILGAFAEQITPLLENFPQHTVFNPDWAEGMGSSIRCGLKAVLDKATDCPRVMVLLADQVFLEVEDFGAMLGLAVANPGKVVAASYAGKCGVPAVFPARLFHVLLGLRGDKGARDWIRSHPADVVALPMAAAERDVDVLGDWEGSGKLSQ